MKTLTTENKGSSVEMAYEDAIKLSKSLARKDTATTAKDGAQEYGTTRYEDGSWKRGGILRTVMKFVPNAILRYMQWVERLLRDGLRNVPHSDLISARF